MLLLPTSDLAKLLLRNPSSKTLQSSHDLREILAVHDIALRLADESLDLNQAVGVEVITQTVLHLCHHLGEELLLLHFLDVEDLIDKSNLQHLLGCDALAHDQRFIGFTDSKTLDEATAGSSFGDESEGGEGRQEEGVGSRVDEVAE